MKKITVGVIGAGRWGKNIIKTLDTLPEAEVRFIVAESEHTLSNYKEHSAQKVTDHTLLLKEKLDVVFVATPPSTHFSIAKDFLENGTHVFIEKPLTLSVKEALALRDLSAKSGKIIFVGHIHLYNPAYKKMKEIIVGKKIKLIVGEGSNNGPFRDDYSSLSDWAPHDLSVMLDLLQEMPKSVQAWGVNLSRPQSALYDLSVVKLIFPSGAVGMISVSWLLPQKKKKITVVTDSDSVVFDDVAEEKLSVFTDIAPQLSPDSSSLIWREGILTHPAYESGMPLTEEIKAFLTNIRTGEKPLTDVEQGIQTVKILEAAEESIRTNGKEIFLS